MKIVENYYYEVSGEDVNHNIFLLLCLILKYYTIKLFETFLSWTMKLLNRLL